MPIADRVSIAAESSHPALRGALDGRPLAEAARMLQRHEHERGFATYDAEQLDFYRLPPYRGLSFTLQHVPRRGERPHAPAVCPVCIDAVAASGQAYLGIILGQRPHRVLANPYAFMPSALTIVAADHRPQGWNPMLETSSEAAYAVATEAAALAAALEGYLVIWNGIRAGASLPAHAHLSAFELPIGHGALAVAQVTAREQYRSGWYGQGGEYPMTFHFVRGEADDAAEWTAVAMREWDRLQEQAATGNLVATVTSAGTDMYYFPRNVRYPRAPWLAGALGALELCGCFVLSTDWELEALRQGHINVRTLYAALRAVSPAKAAELGARGVPCGGSRW